MADISLEESGIVVADNGHDGGVARNGEAYTVMDSPVHRDQFFDELYEVCTWPCRTHISLGLLELLS